MKKMNTRTHSVWKKARATVLLAAGLSFGAWSPGFAQTLVSADFTGQTLPTGWSNIDNGTSGQVWEFNNPAGRGLPTGGNPGFDADFAILDSDNYGFGCSQDASLQTDTFDASGVTGAIYLSFDQNYYSCCGSVADVDVWNGSSWVNVLDQTTTSVGTYSYPDMSTAVHSVIDITSACGSSSTAIVRFHYTGSWAYWWAIDNVEIKVVTCSAPGNLVASALTASSATVSWSAPVTTVGNGYQYYYSTSSTAPATSATPSGSTTDTFANLTGLSSNTTYYAWARALCSSTDTSDWSSSFVTFTTPCVADSAPWTDNVEGQSGTAANSTVDPCWTATPNAVFSGYAWNVTGTGATPSSSTGPDAAHSGTKYFFTEASYGSQGDTALLETPQVVISSLTTPTLEFYYHMYGSTMGNMYIQATDDGGTTWTTLDSLIGQQQTSGTAAWTQKLLSLGTLSGTVMVRFVGVRGSSFYGDMAIDDISIIDLPTCFPPADTSLAISNITASGATFSWGSATPAPGNGYGYYLSTSNTSPADTTTATGTTTDTFATLSSLTANTQYYIWVRSMCSSTSSSVWSASATFTTPCVADTAPWTDDLEGQTGTGSNAAINPCWTATPLIANFDYSWTLTTTGTTPSSSTGPDVAHSGNNYFFTEASDGVTGDTAYLVSPEVVISNLTNPGLEYYYHMYGATMGNLYVQVSDNGGTSWTTVDSLIGQQQASGSAAWLQHLIPLTGFSGSVNIRFMGIRGSSFTGDMAIDDISIKQLPTCFAPSSATLVASGVTADAATITWNNASPAPGSGYGYYYSTTNTAPSDTTASTGSTVDTFVNLTSLSANTQYYVWIRSKCSGTDSSEWTSSVGFKTLCLADNLPYSAPIQAAVPPAVPDCMTTELLNPLGTNWVSANSFGSYGFTGNYLQCNYTGFGDGAMNSWIFTNQLNLQAGTAYKLSFRYGNNSTSYVEKLAVAIGSSPAASSMGTPIFDNTNISLSGSVDTTIYFTVPTTGAYSIGFHGHSDENQYYLYLSDISVDTAPACDAPNTLASSNITASSASVSWTGTASNYLVEYGPTGFALGTGTQVAATASPVSVSGLNPNTTYDFYVRSICIPGIDSSAWSSSGSFTTLCNTPVVNLGADTAICSGASVTIYSGNTDTNATYLWSDGSTADSLVVSAVGTYYLTLTNQFGCSAADTIAVSAGVMPTINLGADTGFCSGSSLTLYTGNTDPNTTALWSDGSTADSLVATATGDYSVRLTNQAGCSASDTISIAVYAMPLVGLGADTGFCAGGVLTLYTGNVDTSATLLWSDGSTGDSLVVDSTGNYYVTVTSEHNCTATDTISVNVFAVPVVNLGADTSICAGNSLVLTAGDSTTTNLWSDGSTGDSLNVTTTGDYFVTVTNANNCSSSDTIAVNVAPQPVVVGITGTITDSSCSYRFEATGVQNATGYDWNFGDGSPHDSTQTPSHSYTTAGTYWVTLTVFNSCGIDTSSVSVECTGLGIHQVALDNSQLQLYPNPARDLVMLKNNSTYEMKSIVVYNVLGQIIFQGKTSNSSVYQLNVQNYASGMYNVKIMLADGSWALRKFEIRK